MSESPRERMPEEDDTTEAPLTMAASVVLTNLPKDASKALEGAGKLAVQKGIPIRFHLAICQHTNNENTLHPPSTPSHSSQPPLPPSLPTNPHHSHNPSPTHRLSPPPNPTHLQAVHQPVFRNDSTFSAEETGGQGA